MIENAKITILTLIDNLSSDFVNYFEEKKFELVQRNEVIDMATLDYILVSDEHDAREASIDFDTMKNNISIVCINDAAVVNAKSFLLHDGRLCIGSDHLKSELGNVLLDNFFNKQRSVHLADNFSGKFNQVESISLTNTFASGESFDKVCYEVLRKGFNLLTLRTFLDHSLIFATYLKQRGSAELPFVYEYSFNQEQFCLNMQLNVQEFFAEYLFDTFGEYQVRSPQKYIMTVLRETCDFLDITYVSETNKLMVSALWDSAGFLHGGMSFNEVETASRQLQRREDTRRKEFDLAQNLAQEERNNIDLPGGILEDWDVPESNSYLRVSLDEIMQIISTTHEEAFPNKDITKLSLQDIKSLLPTVINEKLEEEDYRVIQGNLATLEARRLVSDKVEVAKKNFEDDPSFQDEIVSTSANTLAEEVSQKVSGSALDDFLESTVVKGKPDNSQNSITIGGEFEDEDDERIEIKGGKESADDFKQTVRGLKDEASDFVTHLSGSFDEEDVFKTISGDKDDLGSSMSKWVVKSLGQSDSLKKSPSSMRGFLRDMAPKKLKGELQKYAKDMGVSVQELTSEQLGEFKLKRLPGVIKNLVEDREAIDEFATRLEGASPDTNALNFEKMVAKSDEDNDFSESLRKSIVEKVKSLGTEIPDSELQNSLKEVIAEKLKVILEDDELSTKDKEEKKRGLINQIAESLNLPVAEVAALVARGTVKSNKSVEKLIQEKIKVEGRSLQDSGSAFDVQLSLKLKEVEAENKKLKESLANYGREKEAQQAAKTRIDELQRETAEEVQVEVSSDAKELQYRVNSVSDLSSEDKKQVVELIEAEAKAKAEVKKLELEAAGREAVFSQDLERATKALKAKDYIIEKAKQTMREVVSKKEKELDRLKDQVHSLSQKIQGGEDANLKAEVKQLKAENNNLSKASEIYKSKLDSMAKNLKNQKNDSGTAQLAEENRTLKRIKANLERQAESQIKQNKKWEERLQKVTSSELKLKVENRNLQSDLKTSQLQIRKLKEQSQQVLTNATKAASSQNDQLIKDFDMVQTKNLALEESLRLAENKIKELTDSIRVAEEGRTKDSNKNLDHTIELRRMTSELDREKTQNIELQNKIEALTKEVAASKEHEIQNSAKTGGDPVKQRLERSVKKLNSEMVKAQSEVNVHKKEAIKAKKEIVGLKNQLAASKKELEKLKKQLGSKSKKAA